MILLNKAQVCFAPCRTFYSAEYLSFVLNVLQGSRLNTNPLERRLREEK